MGFFDLLFGSSDRKAETHNTAQQASQSTTALPDWQMAYIRPQLERIAGMRPPEYYAGALTAERSPTSLAAERMAYARAMGGSPDLHGAQQYNRAVLAGDYLAGNPYLDSVYGNAAARVRQSFVDSTLPAVASMFSAAGRYGPGAMGKQVDRAQQALGETLGRLASEIYGQNYARERTAMEAAAGRAPALAAADYADADALARYGSTADAYRQAAIDRDVQRYQFNQLAPWQAEQARLAMLAGDYGGRSVTNTGSSSSYGVQTQEGSGGGLLSGVFGTGLAGFGSAFGSGLAGAALRKWL
jgi:hypothetical protein